MDCHSVKAKVTHFALLIGLPLLLSPDLRLQVGGPRRVEVEQSLPPRTRPLLRRSATSTHKFWKKFEFFFDFKKILKNFEKIFYFF